MSWWRSGRWRSMHWQMVSRLASVSCSLLTSSRARPGVETTDRYHPPTKLSHQRCFAAGVRLQTGYERSYSTADRHCPLVLLSSLLVVINTSIRYSTNSSSIIGYTYKPTAIHPAIDEYLSTTYTIVPSGRGQSLRRIAIIFANGSTCSCIDQHCFTVDRK